MSAITFTAAHPAAGPRARLQLLARMMLLPVVAIWVFSGGIVFVDPSPYELLFVIVLGLFTLAGIPVHPHTRPMILMIMLFMPAAYIAALQVQFITVAEAILYSTVTAFLVLTSFVTASFVAEMPYSRLRLINSAYIASATVVALIGIAAYLRLIPGQGLFLEFGRARATLTDPNIFAPFLIYPAAVMMQRLFLGRSGHAMWNACILTILFVGVFVSFSRGGWGHFALTAIAVFALAYALHATGWQRARMFVMALVGLGLLTIVTALLLSIPAVRELFEVRAELVQDYDTGPFGRFGRQILALRLIADNPIGIGPLQFAWVTATEEPHNTYTKVLMAYGWLGGAGMLWLIGATVWRGVKCMTIPSPNRLLLVPLFATFVPLAIEAFVIDVDHWRHFFLLIGLIWGVTAGYGRVSARQQDQPVP